MSTKNPRKEHQGPGRTSLSGDDIFRLHDVTLDYAHTPRRAIIADCWNTQGSLVWIQTLHANFGYDNPLKQYAQDWEMPFLTSPPLIWSTYVDRIQKPGVTGADHAEIERQLIAETIEELASKTFEINPDLVIFGIQAADYGRLTQVCLFESIDLTKITENGHLIVNGVRGAGYQGNLVAVKLNNHRDHKPLQCPFVDTPFNRKAFQALYRQGVVTKGHWSTATMERMLQGGPFQSDYRLENERTLLATGQYQLRELEPL